MSADPLRAAFETWIDTTARRFSPPLSFPEVRKGVQALSRIYVERRHEGALGARAAAGEGKRAALAIFYAPIHFTVSVAALAEIALPDVGRIVDLGCGTGATGAAAAVALAAGVGGHAPRSPASGVAPAVLGIDASGWALGEARHTWRAFGLAGSGRRGVLPAALPRTGAGDLLVAGWMLNELPEAARDALIAALEDALDRGAALLVLEPLARGAAPWWPSLAERLARRGARQRDVKLEFERPPWIERLDDASGLDHREIGARVLFAPPAPRVPTARPGR